MDSLTYVKSSCKNYSVVFRRFLCFLLILLPFFIALIVSTQTFYNDSEKTSKSNYSTKLLHTIFNTPNIYDKNGHKESATSAWLFWLSTFGMCGIVGKIEQHFYWKYRNEVYRVNEILSNFS